MSVKFIAEVSSNHNKDLDRSKEFIRVAADIGCYAVKFQLFRIEELFAPEILSHDENTRKRREWELPIEYIPHLANQAHQLNLKFACTPFYLDAVDELLPYVDFYKIASYELLWADLLTKTASKNKPVVLSTGMATLDEIRRAVEIIMKTGNKQLTLLHCISGYPTPPEEANLKTIKTLRDTFGCDVGWSDHSVSPAVLYRAIHKWNANMVEFHLDLDGKGEEFKTGHCWLPDDIANVIATVNKGYLADGNGVKAPAPSELADRDWRADPMDGLRPIKKIRGKY